MIEIVAESPADAPAIETLLDDCFGAERRLKTAERLREGRLPAQGLALVGRDGGRLVGTIRLWEVEAGGIPALLLGPVAVDCDCQGRGIGAALIETSLHLAEAMGHGGVILVGDEPYYSRFGFARRPVMDLELPGPVDLDRFLGLELVPGALRGARGMIVGTGGAGRHGPGARLSRSRRASGGALANFPALRALLRGAGCSSGIGNAIPKR